MTARTQLLFSQPASVGWEEYEVPPGTRLVVIRGVAMVTLFSPAHITCTAISNIELHHHRLRIEWARIALAPDMFDCAVDELFVAHAYQCAEAAIVEFPTPTSAQIFPVDAPWPLPDDVITDGANGQLTPNGAVLDFSTLYSDHPGVSACAFIYNDKPRSPWVCWS